MVIVNGDSPLLLSQVQSVATGASIQEYNGQRFIQAGLFDNPSLAQQQVSTLATQGIGAEIVTVGSTTTDPAVSTSTPVQPDVSQQSALPAMPPPELLPATPVPREVEFGQPPAPEQLTNPVPAEPSDLSEPSDSSRAAIDRDRAFYVVVPGGSDNLEAMASQIIRLGEGIGIAEMVQTDNSRGSHVRIGPFVDRGSANRWRRYLRDFGMDARVYYSR
jgi:hypothetical protein